MERKQKDFSKGKIYIIRNSENDKVYIGSTCQTLAQRMTTHRSDAKNTKRQHLLLYQAFQEFGINKFYIELLEDFPCDRNEQLLQREGHYIRQFNSFKNGYNRDIAGRTAEEYNLDNKEILKERRKKYEMQNRVKINEQHNKYYKANKEKILQQQNKVIECKCGCLISRAHISRHMRTQKHIDAMAKLSQS